MSAWQGLLKKEFRLGRTWLITGLLLLLGGIIGNYFFNGGFGYGIIGFGIFSVTLHFPYMGIYMFSSLNKEADKMHLWLHNPQPARNLLLAKFLNGLFSMSISLTVFFLLTFTIAKATIVNPPVDWGYIWEFAIFAVLNLIAISIYIGIWVVLAWIVFRILKNKIGGWAWLVLSVIFTVSIPVLEDLQGTRLYYFLTDWGPIKLESVQLISRLINELSSPEPNITIGFYVFYLVVGILVFLLSSWLLDNKVEV